MLDPEVNNLNFKSQKYKSIQLNASSYLKKIEIVFNYNQEDHLGKEIRSLENHCANTQF